MTQISENVKNINLQLQTSLEFLDSTIRGKILPNQLNLVRAPLVGHLVEFDEESGQFKKGGISYKLLSKECPSITYAIQINTVYFPEFVQDFNKDPFLREIPAAAAKYRYLEKSEYNSILRLSYDFIQKLSKSIKEHSQEIPDYNLFNFYTELFLNRLDLDGKPCEFGQVYLTVCFELTDSFS